MRCSSIFLLITSAAVAHADTQLGKMLPQSRIFARSSYGGGSQLYSISESYQSIHTYATKFHNYIQSPECTQGEAYAQFSEFQQQFSSAVESHGECSECFTDVGGYTEYRESLKTLFTSTYDVCGDLYHRYPKASEELQQPLSSFSRSLSVVIKLAGLLKIDVHALLLSLNINLDLYLNLNIDILGLIHLNVGSLVGGLLDGHSGLLSSSGDHSSGHIAE